MVESVTAKAFGTQMTVFDERVELQKSEGLSCIFQSCIFQPCSFVLHFLVHIFRSIVPLLSLSFIFQSCIFSRPIWLGLCSLKVGRTYLARNKAAALRIQERRWSAESYRFVVLYTCHITHSSVGRGVTGTIFLRYTPIMESKRAILYHF